MEKKRILYKNIKGKLLFGRGRSLTVVTNEHGTRVHARA